MMNQFNSFIGETERNNNDSRKKNILHSHLSNMWLKNILHVHREDLVLQNIHDDKKGKEKCYKLLKLNRDIILSGLP